MHIKVGDVVDWGNHKNLVVADVKYRGYEGFDGKLRCVDHVYLKAQNCSFGTWCPPERATEIKLSSDCRVSKTPRALKIVDLKIFSNPLSVEEDYILPVKGCSRCGFEVCCCDALGYTDEPKIDCSLNHLAQALFDTDLEVLAFVERVSEAKHAKDPSVARKRVLDLAWERDEQGWATRARERAAAVKGAL